MRARTAYVAVAALSVGYVVLTAPGMACLTVMLMGAFVLWKLSRRAGVRR